MATARPAALRFLGRPNQQQCLQGVLHAAAVQLWLQDAAKLYARQLVITNTSNVPATLMHVGLYPNTYSHYLLLDDHGLCTQWASHSNSSRQMASRCVRLQPGATSPCSRCREVRRAKLLHTFVRVQRCM